MGNYETCLKWRSKNRERYLNYKKEWARKKWADNKEFRKRENIKEVIKVRKNPKYRERKNKNSKEWYERNKKRHQRHVLRYYYENKDKWRVRRLTLSRKKILLNLLGKQCKRCGSKRVLEFHHKTYNLVKGITGEDMTRELKKITILLCRKCHRKLHEKYPNIEN